MDINFSNEKMLINITKKNRSTRNRTKDLNRKIKFVRGIRNETNANFFSKVKIFQSKIDNDVIIPYNSRK